MRSQKGSEEGPGSPGRIHEPPLLSAFRADTAENYSRIADAMGLLPDGVTVEELAFAARRLKEERDALRKRADGYEAVVAEIAEILEQPAPVWTEGSELWALPLWRHISDLKSKLTVAEANDAITAENLATVMREHEREMQDLRDRKRIRLARLKLKLVRAKRTIRELQRYIALLDGTLQGRADMGDNLLDRYDRLTLALSYKWGEAKKEEFVRQIEDPDSHFMELLRRKWTKKFPDEAGEAAGG